VGKKWWILITNPNQYSYESANLKVSIVLLNILRKLNNLAILSNLNKLEVLNILRILQ